MAYVKHGTGPNDYKKGNRTRGKDRRGHVIDQPGTNLTGLQEASKARAERAEHYRKIAEQQAKVIKYGQEYAGTLRDNLAAYIIETQNHNKPLTIAGLIRAAGVSADTYYRYRKGEADHLLYAYMDEHGISFDHEGTEVTDADGEKVFLCRLSEIIKQAELAVQQQREEACSSLRGNPAGNIFLLKAQQDFQDTPPDQRTTNNNTLVMNISTLDEAKEAMKRLEEG